jgi:hypothetical protein
MNQPDLDPVGDLVLNPKWLRRFGVKHARHGDN